MSELTEKAKELNRLLKIDLKIRCGYCDEGLLNSPCSCDQVIDLKEKLTELLTGDILCPILEDYLKKKKQLEEKWDERDSEMLRNDSLCCLIDQLKEENTRLKEQVKKMRGALKHVDDWFERLKEDHESKLNHGLEEACRNWDSLSQEPLDLRPVKEALTEVEDGCQ